MSIEREPVTRPLELDEVTFTINEFNRRQEVALAEGRRLELNRIVKLIHEEAGKGLDWVLFLLEGNNK